MTMTRGYRTPHPCTGERLRVSVGQGCKGEDGARGLRRRGHRRQRVMIEVSQGSAQGVRVKGYM